MTQEKYKRKLAAILMADVKGYSRLMGRDEEGTVSILSAYREVMTGSIQRHQGRVVNTAGDSILAEFGSVVDAVRCAVEIQEELKDKNKELPEDRRMEFRIGINLGDVVEEGDTIYGDGVNIAARLESLAAAGGICISGIVYDQIKNKLAFGYESLGEQSVKNIAEPVRVYRVLMEPGVAISREAIEKKPQRRRWPMAALSLGVVLVVLGTAVAIWRLNRHPEPPPGEVNPKEKVMSSLPGASSTARPPSEETASKEKLTPSLQSKPSTTSTATAKQEVASTGRMAFTLPDKPSIAVLPFVSMSSDKEQEYFSDGLTEDLITDISKISGLLVISRNSTFVYKGKAIKVRQVAEELGVRYVLEGSVRKTGDLVRINAQLIDGTTDHHLWAERYDGKMDDVFSLQDKITQRIVSALELKLTAVEKELMARKGTANAEAYDAFLRGWEHYLRLRPDDLARAVQYFKRALELDPNYGRAKAAMAWAYLQGASFAGGGVVKDQRHAWWETRLLSLQYLTEAIKQPTALAHLLNSEFYFYRRQHEDAISEIGRALVLEPNDPNGLAWMARALNLIGKPQEAIDLANRAMRLDPQKPVRYLLIIGLAQFSMGHFEEAATYVEKVLRLNPALVGVNGLRAATYGLLGREQEAQAALDIYKNYLVTLYPFSPNLQYVMYAFPFKDRLVADRFAAGLLKAGLPGKPSGYLHGSKENQLTGKAIRDLLFGSAISGIFPDGQHWTVEIDKEEQITYRGPAVPDTGSKTVIDTGRIRIEGDTGCFHSQKNFLGLEWCWTAFRNANRTSEGKDEYFMMSDIGVFPFSPVR